MIKEDDIQFKVDHESDEHYVIITSRYDHRNRCGVSKAVINSSKHDFDPIREMKFRMKMQLVDHLYKGIIIQHHELKRQLMYLIHPRHYGQETTSLLNRFAPTDRERFLV